MWHPPGELQLKCNVDAAFRVSNREWGWGAAVRNHVGTLLSFRTGWLRGTPEVREGEAMALLDALLWIQASGVEDMVFEIDSSEVAAATMGHNDDYSEFDNIAMNTACPIDPPCSIPNVLMSMVDRGYSDHLWPSSTPSWPIGRQDESQKEEKG
ncbi:hypothetical protein LINPERHAP1_LOCUS11707 [Linum perenne]